MSSISPSLACLVLSFHTHFFPQLCYATVPLCLYQQMLCFFLWIQAKHRSPQWKRINRKQRPLRSLRIPLPHNPPRLPTLHSIHIRHRRILPPSRPPKLRPRRLRNIMGLPHRRRLQRRLQSIPSKPTCSPSRNPETFPHRKRYEDCRTQSNGRYECRVCETGACCAD